MDKQALLDLLGELDMDLQSEHEIILIGGAAMILHFGAARATRDIDALFIRGDARRLRDAVRSVGLRHDLPEDWLNDAAKGFADILPHDFTDRLAKMDLPFQHLRVSFLGLPEQITMKIVALREQDLEDLELLMPQLSDEQKATVKAIMRHVSTVRQDWALKIRYFLLEQGWEIN